MNPATTSHLSTASPPDSTAGGPGRRTVGVTILYHPDTLRVGEVAPLVDLGSGATASLARSEPSFLIPGGAHTGPLDVAYISRSPVRFEAPQRGGVRLLVPDGGTALRADGKDVGPTLDVSDAQLSSGIVLELAKSVVLLLHVLEPDFERVSELGLVGRSAAIEAVRREILRVALIDVPVLLRGETGVGKELVARAIHAASPRRERPFVAVNMSEITPGLAASTLFGHRKGAFTGADASHDGYFLQADSGTLFLDEIGDTVPEVQPLLLRALQGDVSVLGGRQAKTVDIRIIAATDADLEAAIDVGGFRTQLFQRLSGYEIVVPPLRERRDDVGRLLIHFLGEALATFGRERLLGRPMAGKKPWLPASLVARLVQYHWPGNVRQLRNFARELAITSHDQPECRPRARMSEKLLPLPAPSQPEAHATDARVSTRKRGASEFSEAELREALRLHAYNISATADFLKVSKSRLFERIARSETIRQAHSLDAEAIRSALRAAPGNLDSAAASLEVSVHGLRLRMTELGISLHEKGRPA